MTTQPHDSPLVEQDERERLVRALAEDGQLDGSTDAPPELIALAQLVLELLAESKEPK
jgi:hypothetical protein